MAKKQTTPPRPAARAARRPVLAPATPVRRLLPWIGGSALFVAVTLALLLLAQPSATEAPPGQRMPVQGQQHIEPGQTPAYNSDPPTSGWHYHQDLPASFYEVRHPDELLVHNREHGHVVISYDCGKLADCEGTRRELRSVFQAYNVWKVTVVPREYRGAAIALTAWGWIDKMDSFAEPRTRRFIDAWRNRGPEATMD